MKENKSNCINEQTIKKTTSYHHGNLKEELLTQAIEIIQNEGVDALTLAVLSKKLGTSRSAIYRHFSSKDELMQNVLLYGFEIFENEIAAVFEQKEKTVLQRLHKMGQVYIGFAIHKPNLYRILFGDKFQTIREETCDIEDEEQANGFHALVKLLLEGQEDKTLKPTDAFLQAQIIHSAVHGLASLYIDGHIHVKDNIDELYEICFETLSQGIASKE